MSPPVARTRSRSLPVRWALVVLLAAGCGQGSRDDGEAPPSGEAMSDVPPARYADTIAVDLDEYAIALPDTVGAGPRTLRIRNRGFEEHDLVVRFRGTDSVAWRVERRLDPGETRHVEVELEPGLYAVICTVSNHEGRGMFTDLVVERAAAP